MKKAKVYVGGALFTEKDAWQRNRESDKLKKSGLVEAFNPLTDNSANDKGDISKLPTAEDIYNGDTDRIIEANYILGELDGFDPGLMMEWGIAIGINIVLDKLTQEERDRINIPYKTLVTHSSDIRTKLAGEYDEYRVPLGWNQYVVGAHYANDFKIHDSSDTAIEWILEKERDKE